MDITVTEQTLKALAEKLVARLNSLGVVSKSGEPLVVDQGFEAIAALAGYRNQHALRSTLTQPQGKPQKNKAPAPAHVIRPEQIDLLKALGYQLFDSEYHLPYWEKGDEASEDFRSENEAWLDAWKQEANLICEERKLSSEMWEGIGVDCQMLLLESRVPCSLEREWGSEHPYYTQDMWKQAESSQASASPMAYWTWVHLQIEEAGGADEHCSCGHPLNDGQGYDGLCGDCADRKYA